MSKNIKRIVLTGGPNGGKTTGAPRIRAHLSKFGWRILIVPEAATFLINAGIKPMDSKFFQEELLRCQLTHEQSILKLAQDLPDEKILIIHDRGALDNIAYTGREWFAELAKKFWNTPIGLRGSYDGVFHLVTAAKGAPEFYVTAADLADEGREDSNTVREESLEQAIALDDATLDAWIPHQHVEVIDNSTNFHAKMARLVDAVANLVGEPESYEVERKFLIERPSVELLESLSKCRKTHITQNYLLSSPELEVRLRRETEDDYSFYMRTTKQGRGIRRIETNRTISEDEYRRDLLRADPSMSPIVKDRYRYMSPDKYTYFEFDIYPTAPTEAIVEIELSDESERVTFPDFVKVIAEVTDDDRYSNRSLARGTLSILK